jgi:hypothetical protein
MATTLVPAKTPVKTPAPPQANLFASAIVIVLAAIAAIFVLRISPLSSPWAHGYDPTGARISGRHFRLSYGLRISVHKRRIAMKMPEKQRDR